MKPRKTILIYSHNPQTARELKNLLYKNIKKALVNVAMSQEGVYQAILSRKINILIVEFENLSSDDASFVQSLYKNLQNLLSPLILITSQNENSKSFDIPYHHLYKPIDNEGFLNLITKILSDKSDIAIQRSRRFKTKQQAYVRNLFSHEEEKIVQIQNLSETGAYFEFKEKPNWKKDEILNIKIVLEDLSIQHELQAKIMWIAENKSVIGHVGVGVKFISSADVHKYLIEGLGKAKKYISNL